MAEDFKQFCYECMHKTIDWKSRVFNGFIVFFIVLSVISIPLHFLPNIDPIKPYIAVFDKIAITIFTIEYALRIWSAKDRLHYIFSWWGMVDLFAILPFYLAAVFPGLAGIEVLLFLRIIRILKFNRLYGQEDEILKHHQVNKHGSFQPIQGEFIEKIVQKHPIEFLFGVLISLLLLSAGLFIMAVLNFNMFSLIAGGLLVFAAIIFFVKAWIDYHYDVMYITNHRVILQNRELFGSVTNDIGYDAITNVVPDSMGIYNWIFKTGDVKIETAFAEGTLLFRNTMNPGDIVGLITANRQKQRARKEKFEEKIQHLDEPKMAKILDNQI